MGLGFNKKTGELKIEKGNDIKQGIDKDLNEAKKYFAPLREIPKED